jgi:hypothetical protein
MCPEEYKDVTSLAAHYRSAHENGIYLCRCGIALTSNKRYKIHKEVYHQTHNLNTIELSLTPKQVNSGFFVHNNFIMPDDILEDSELVFGPNRFPKATKKDVKKWKAVNSKMKTRHETPAVFKKRASQNRSLYKDIEKRMDKLREDSKKY